MDKCRPQWLGAPAGQHGPNTFYKGCKFFKNGKWRILSMGEFFFLKTSETDPLCIAELQLLWQDDKAENGDGLMLSSSKLYFLPEDTPEGRTVHHGEDEVVGVSGKAIVRLEDLIDWVCTDVRWSRGCRTICEKDLKKQDSHINAGHQQVALFAQNSGLNVSDINKEKQIMGYDDDGRDKVIILNYPNYCRYCGALKRIEHAQEEWISHILVRTLGAFTVPHRNTRVMFCKDEFDHPTLGFNEKLCDHLAPNMKGRPRKKKLSIRSNSNEDVFGDSSNDATEHAEVNYKEFNVHQLSKLERKKLRGKYQTKIVNGKVKTEVKRVRPKDEATFLAGLFKFMKDRNSPIDRVPNLGFKQIDLFLFYTMGQKFGGYEAITARRLWKKLYDVLGGSVGSTSAATCTRRHYERLILPYERYLNKQEHKPLPGQPPPPPTNPTKGISILAKPSKHKEKDPNKHHKKKDKHHSKDRPKGMTKAEETWIRDRQKHAVAAGLIHQTILTPVPIKPVGREQPQSLTREVQVSSSQTASSMMPNTPSSVPVGSPVTSFPPPAQSQAPTRAHLPMPVSVEMMIVPREESASSSSAQPPLKMKLKLNKRHKEKKRPKVLKDQLRELGEQRAMQQKAANNQLYANSLQLSTPPIARKKTLSIADILNHQAKMQAKQKASQAANAAEKTPSYSVTSSTAGNPTQPPLSTAAIPIPFPGQPIMVKTEEGMPVGPLIFTLPQMLPGGGPAVSSSPIKTEDVAGSSGLTSTTAASLTFNSNMATVLHVGQPLQVMQVPTPSSTFRDSAASGSVQGTTNTSAADSDHSTASATTVCWSYPHNVGIASSGPTSLTAVVNPMKPPPHSPGPGSALTSGKDTASARPSVIQHTQHVQAQTPETGMTSPSYRNAIQPSDLILRNLSHEKAAATAAAAAAAASTSATTSAPVVGQKLSDLPKDAVVVTPRFVNPYMAYIPMPMMVGSSKTEPNTEEPKVETKPELGSKRRRTESGKENISRPLSPHGFRVDRLGKVTPLSYPTLPATVPFQEEPCDLSMPKRKCGEDEAPATKRDTTSHPNKHRSSRKYGESSKDRTRWHEESGTKYKEDVAVASSVSSQYKVKMTPNPRGSIMQGVINPSALSPSSFSSKSSELHRDTPSRHSTGSNEAAASPHPPSFPYLPHPSMQGVPSDKQPKSQFVFPEFNPHLPAMMGYHPRFFPPQFMPGPLLTRPDLLPTSLPPGMPLSPEQLMRREMFFPPHFPFHMRPPFIGSPPVVRDSQQPYMPQT